MRFMNTKLGRVPGEIVESHKNGNFADENCMNCLIRDFFNRFHRVPWFYFENICRTSPAPPPLVLYRLFTPSQMVIISPPQRGERQRKKKFVGSKHWATVPRAFILLYNIVRYFCLMNYSTRKGKPRITNSNLKGIANARTSRRSKIYDAQKK